MHLRTFHTAANKIHHEQLNFIVPEISAPVTPDPTCRRKVVQTTAKASPCTTKIISKQLYMTQSCFSIIIKTLEEINWRKFCPFYSQSEVNVKVLISSLWHVQVTPCRNGKDFWLVSPSIVFIGGQLGKF